MYFFQHQTVIQKSAIKVITVTSLLGLVLAGCSDNDSSDSSTNSISAEQQQLETLLDDFIEIPNVVNTMIAVNDATQNGSFGVARGLAIPSSAEPMSAEYQFHIASMTKPFTATLLLQLIESGQFTLETTLGEAFGTATLSELFPDYTFTRTNPDGISVATMSINDIQQSLGESQGAGITLRQLMQHTHGMPDLTFDAPIGLESLAAQTIATSVGLTEPGQLQVAGQWSGHALLEYYLSTSLPLQSFFKPGEGYHYGDTGPVIAALLIERTLGISLAEAYRTRIFDPLGMNDTYLHHYEDERRSSSPGLSHRHFDLSEIDNQLGNASDNAIGNVDVDEAGWNTSLDWAGGGLVSTAADIDRFYRGLFSGQLLSNSSIMGDAQYRVTGDEESPIHGLGFSLKINPETGDVTAYEHGGFWGSYMSYYPAKDTSVVFTANQVEFEEYGKLLSTMDELFIE